MPDGTGYTITDLAAGNRRALAFDKFLALELPPRQNLLAPWLPEKGLAMVYGPRGIGKTYLTLGVAYAVACGGTFLKWQAPRPRRVLIIDGEMPAAVLQERVVRIVDAAETKPQPDHLRVLATDLMSSGINIADPADQAALEPDLAGIDLIIADNISTLAKGGPENEAESWLPIQEWSLAQRRAGRSVLFVHHAGKGGQQRGTSRREDVLDSVLALRRPDDATAEDGCRFEVHFEKARGFTGADATSFEAHLHGDAWTCRDLTDVDLDRVVELSRGKMSTRDIAQDLGMSKSKVSRLQQRAKTEGRLR